ncbi:MAG: hypothetical protein KJO94_04550, partial [Eudoraea sp.]|nr:hypothetical protein [Eudoraea sp.]
PCLYFIAHCFPPSSRLLSGLWWITKGPRLRSRREACPSPSVCFAANGSFSFLPTIEQAPVFKMKKPGLLSSLCSESGPGVASHKATLASFAEEVLIHFVLSGILFSPPSSR